MSQAQARMRWRGDERCVHRGKPIAQIMAGPLTGTRLPWGTRVITLYTADLAGTLDVAAGTFDVALELAYRASCPYCGNRILELLRPASW